MSQVVGQGVHVEEFEMEFKSLKWGISLSIETFFIPLPA